LVVRPAPTGSSGDLLVFAATNWVQ
jgi:hypothetical protein